MGAAGLVAKHFAADNPTAIASRRTRLAVKKRDAKDPNTIYGNNRDVPVPVWYKEDVLKVWYLFGEILVPLKVNGVIGSGGGGNFFIFDLLRLWYLVYHHEADLTVGGGAMYLSSVETWNFAATLK